VLLHQPSSHRYVASAVKCNFSLSLSADSESCAVVLYVNAGAAEPNVELTVSRREAAAQRAPCNAKSVQKRDTPRKRSEPIPSSVHSATTAAASVSCPAGFTVPAEHDPVGRCLIPY